MLRLSLDELEFQPKHENRDRQISNSRKLSFSRNGFKAILPSSFKSKFSLCKTKSRIFNLSYNSLKLDTSHGGKTG